ncbi:MULTISPECIES: HAD-IA family hydrolase [Streptomyces]|uniref:HAD-IA family hydrolase n=1 Tax=Streptomyces doudnae TaxID=3075536 RepID=A0ABD5EHZ5_9ACTN|nr:MULTISPECIES: HAD-IA family hydrolase [unclassified Streptomyces]MDT0433920.1 HAD-IA family hydrolase [Streptomyces sp. DSM 41981]MYQ63047.1 HAD-IA family hydrolase [Streptomyces sp. SID4950]SCD49548.1 haloacid dehalogenase superfamily, subfamily IA, variant 3 with third motif having DD or ED [Streptomyces sp. SolWspMP-5a-2]
MTRPPLQAVLFDMDGTLVDTERLWWEAVQHVATGLGRPLTEADQPEVLGRPVEHTADWLARLTATPSVRLGERLHGEFADRVRTGVVPRPGALDLLDALARDDVPTALVTASPRSVADTVLAALGADRFRVSVTADDTARTKPEPDPYLAACAALGVDPARCVAVEDTATGVSSAEAAGCAVVAVPSLAPIDAAPGRTVVASLEEVTPDRLRGLVGPRLRVLSWNLWLGGARVDDHRAKQLKVVLETGADVVGLQETAHTAAAELADALGWHHHQAGENLGVISRHPIVARLGDPDVGFYGAAGVRIAVGRHEVDVWTAHLHYTPYGPYEADFDGLPAAGLIAHEEVRLGQMRETLRRIAEAGRPGVPVVLTGDFNCPSHLDRTDVAWPVTRAAEEAGLRDSYRQVHPDPVRSPGATWSPVHPVHEDDPDRPEPQDRIDYVLYGPGLDVVDSRTVVTGVPRAWPDVAGNDWPSDHAAVLTTFALPGPEGAGAG